MITMTSRIASLLAGLLFMLLLGFFPMQARAETPPGPGPKDRCPVCGMFVKPYPNWMSTLTFEKHPQLFFDGPKDMLRYYFSLPAQGSASKPGRDNLKGIYVTDYYTTRVLPVSEVFFVIGSDIAGPMGYDLVPIAGREAADGFARDHGGKKIVPFDELTPSDLPD